MSLRRQFGALLESPGIVVMPGVYDGISAKVVEAMGFEVAGIGGSGVSNSRLGKPDVGFLDLSTNVAHTRRIVKAVDIPVHVDADTGYGNAMNVYNTVREFEDAGVVSVSIEDQEWPKRCGHMRGKSVIPAEDMVRKVEAAVEARSDSDLHILARTDAATPINIEEAVHRLNLYADAGADYVFADALGSRADIAYVADETDAPLVINMGYGIRERPTTPLISTSELEELGVSMVKYSRIITGAAAMGMQKALETLGRSIEEGRTIEAPELTMGFEEYTDLMGLSKYRDLEERFTTEE